MSRRKDKRNKTSSGPGRLASISNLWQLSEGQTCFIFVKSHLLCWKWRSILRQSNQSWATYHTTGISLRIPMTLWAIHGGCGLTLDLRGDMRPWGYRLCVRDRNYKLRTDKGWNWWGRSPIAQECDRSSPRTESDETDLHWAVFSNGECRRPLLIIHDGIKWRVVIVGTS